MAGEVDLTKQGEPPTAEVVSAFHQNADTDSRSEAIHHTTGPNAGQASPGDHTHRGGDSVFLGAGLTITGSRGGNVALLSIVQVLVGVLGVTDNTTP